MVSRKVTYKSPTGARLATDRYDFNDHIDGYSFRHNVDALDIDPPIEIQSIEYDNLGNALDAITSYILNDTSGAGFITIPDGYDTYANDEETPDTPYDNGVPELGVTLHDLLNNTDNPNHFRIRNGGVVLIKAGTYKFTTTVDIPPGMTIMGEGYGTKLIGTSSSLPIFKVKADLDRTADNAVDSTGNFMYSRQVKLLNLTIADNFVIPKYLGDTDYLLPVNYDGLIKVEEGSSISCENVKFLGKVLNLTGSSFRVSGSPLQIDSTTPSNSTIVNIDNCLIDGFAQVLYQSDGYATGSNNNYLSVQNSNMRLRPAKVVSGVPSTAARDNSYFNIIEWNINISNNTFYFEAPVTGTPGIEAQMLYIYNSGLHGSPEDVEDMCRIIISNNNIRNSNDNLNLIEASDFDNISIFEYGNLQSQVPSISSPASAIKFGSGVKINTTIISQGDTLAIDADRPTNILIIVNEAMIPSATTITLPPHSEGRVIIVKDAGGASPAIGDGIEIARYGGTGSIDGVAASKLIVTAFGTVTLVSDGVSNWYSI